MTTNYSIHPTESSNLPDQLGIPSIKRLEYPLPEGIEDTEDWLALKCPNIYSGRVAVLTEVLTDVRWRLHPTRYSVRWEGMNVGYTYDKKADAFRAFYKLITTP
jgi:hypothetical protein